MSMALASKPDNSDPALQNDVEVQVAFVINPFFQEYSPVIDPVKFKISERTI